MLMIHDKKMKEKIMYGYIPLVICLFGALLVGCQNESTESTPYTTAADTQKQQLPPCNTNPDNSAEASTPPTNCDVVLAPIFYSGVVQAGAADDHQPQIYQLHGKQINGGEALIKDFKLDAGALMLSKYIGQEVVLTGIPHVLDTASGLEVIEVKSIEFDGVVTTQ